MFRPHDIQVTGKSVPTDIARAVIAAAAAEVNGPIEKGKSFSRHWNCWHHILVQQPAVKKCGSTRLPAPILPCIDTTPRAPGVGGCEL
jgi:hypothetical protein